MRLIPTTHIAAAVLAAALAVPVAAWAQTTTTPAPVAGAASAESPRQRVEQHIADLYATLQITPAQQKQWNEFAQVMLDNAQSMDMLVTKNRSSMTTANAEETMQNYAAMAKQHEQNVEKLLPAFRTLYASLTPEQKKAADEAFRERAEARDQKQGAAMQNEPKPGMQKQGG